MEATKQCGYQFSVSREGDQVGGQDIFQWPREHLFLRGA